MSGRVHHLDLKAREPKPVAVRDRAELLHGGEGVVESGTPPGLVGERHRVGFVHEDGELAGEVAGLSGVVEVCVRRQHGDRRLVRRREQCVHRLGREAGVDDHGIIARVGGEQPAVRAVRVGVEHVEPHQAAHAS